MAGNRRDEPSWVLPASDARAAAFQLMTWAGKRSAEPSLTQPGKNLRSEERDKHDQGTVAWITCISSYRKDHQTHTGIKSHCFRLFNIYIYIYIYLAQYSSGQPLPAKASLADPSNWPQSTALWWWWVVWCCVFPLSNDLKVCGEWRTEWAFIDSAWSHIESLSVLPAVSWEF